MSNVNNKYMQNMAGIIWLMSIINMCRIRLVLSAEYGLYYLANVNNKYMQNMACIIWLMSIINYMQNMAGIIWLMSIINMCRIRLVLSG